MDANVSWDAVQIVLWANSLIILHNFCTTYTYEILKQLTDQRIVYSLECSDSQASVNSTDFLPDASSESARKPC